MISFPRFCVAAIGVASLFLLAGCDSESDKTVVAWVNGDKITGDEYNERVQTVTAIPATVNTDAGGLTMINVIRDRLTEQLARKYKSVPSDEDVSQEMDFRIHSDSTLANSISAGKMSQPELLREIKFEIEAIGIGTNGDTVNDKVLQNHYDDIVAGKNPAEKRVVYQPARYTLKVEEVPDIVTATQFIAALKKAGSFKAAAVNVPSISPAAAEEADKEQVATEEQTPSELRSVLESLKPNEVGPSPVVIREPNPTQPLNPQTHYVVVQLLHKENAVMLPFNKIRFHLKQEILQQTHPDWVDHYRRELGTFTKDSQIRIGIKRYEGLLDTYIRPKAVAASTTTGMPSAMTPANPH